MERTSVKLKSNQGSEVNVNCLQIPRICSPIPVVALGQWQDRMRQQNLQLVEDEDKEIDLLIGTKDYYSIVTGNNFKLSTNLMAVETIFGWTLHGTLGQLPSSNQDPTITTKQDGENLKRFPQGENTSSKEAQSHQLHTTTVASANNHLPTQMGSKEALLQPASPNDAGQSSVVPTLIETQEKWARDLTNVFEFSLKIPGRVYEQGEQILQVQTSTLESLLQHTDPTTTLSSSTWSPSSCPCSKSHYNQLFATPAAVQQHPDLPAGSTSTIKASRILQINNAMASSF